MFFKLEAQGTHDVNEIPALIESIIILNLCANKTYTQIILVT